MSDDKWKKLSEDIDKAMKAREHIQAMEKIIKDAQMQTMDYQDNPGDWGSRIDLPKPHWQRSNTSTTYTDIRVGDGNGYYPPDNTSGYVQEVTPTPLIDNYEAYKLLEVLTEILDEVRSINKKLTKRRKK